MSIKTSLQGGETYLFQTYFLGIRNRIGAQMFHIHPMILKSPGEKFKSPAKS